MADDGKQPLIIKKINKGHGGSHGGAWKVAFADFVTAMMAFFLLLWLLGSTSKVQKGAISKYFTDPGGSMIGEGGANASLVDLGEPKLPTAMDTPEAVVPGSTSTAEQEGTEDEQAMQKKLEEEELAQLEALKQEMMEMVESNMAFSDYKDQVLIDITPEGLRIQIVDKDKRPMFDSGSAQMQYYSIAILKNLAKPISQVPNRISITGHTDSALFYDRPEYSNWELSADRANAARRALIKGGVPPTQVARVEGFSDSVLFNEADATDPINRRIAIIVLKKKVDDALKSHALGDWAKPAEGENPPAEPISNPAAEPVPPNTDNLPAPLPPG